MKKSSSSASSDFVIVYFDGVCNLCNRFVDFLIRHDRRGRLRFASLQGRTAHERLPQELQSSQLSLSTVVFVEGDRMYTRSAAAIRAVACLGGLYRLVSIFLLLPPGLRDGIYQAIALHRYEWFGRRETCRLPKPEERERFLD